MMIRIYLFCVTLVYGTMYDILILLDFAVWVEISTASLMILLFERQKRKKERNKQDDEDDEN